MSDLESLALDATLQFLDEVSGELFREEIYGFTFDFSPEEQFLAAAVGTEERLIKTAKKYLSKGYNYSSTDREPTAALTQWLRWSSPEDGRLCSYRSSAFDSLNSYLLAQIKNGELELFGGHLIEKTKRILLTDVFDGRLAKMTHGQRVPKLRAYCSFAIPEVIPWAQETNPPDIYQALCTEIERGYEVGSRISRSK